MTKGVGIGVQMLGESTGELMKPGLTRQELDYIEKRGGPSGPDPFGEIWREKAAAGPARGQATPGGGGPCPRPPMPEQANAQQQRAPLPPQDDLAGSAVFARPRGALPMQDDAYGGNARPAPPPDTMSAMCACTSPAGLQTLPERGSAAAGRAAAEAAAAPQTEWQQPAPPPPPAPGGGGLGYAPPPPGPPLGCCPSGLGVWALGPEMGSCGTTPGAGMTFDGLLPQPGPPQPMGMPQPCLQGMPQWSPQPWSAPQQEWS